MASLHHRINMRHLLLSIELGNVKGNVTENIKAMYGVYINRNIYAI